MKNFWLDMLAKRGDDCDYVVLTGGEIRKLKSNGIDPHELKPRGSKEDLFKCKPSGKVVVRRKTKYFDPAKGDFVFPDEGEIEDTGINIDELPWGARMTIQSEIIEWRVGGFAQPPADVLQRLAIQAAASWQAGDVRVPQALVRHKENGFRLVADKQIDDFEERVAELISRLYPLRHELGTLGAHCQLACVFYLGENERPVISFSHSALSRLVEMGASIDVDVYHLADQPAVAATDT